MVTSTMQHVKVLDIRKLEILPQEADRSRLHFNLYYLKSMLPKVIVRVRLLEFLFPEYCFLWMTLFFFFSCFSLPCLECLVQM